eukprot:m.513221 g.513221  ORF g.513221 m.513221 type:complete len:232 (-) comp21903_c0_seq7:2511-3206(-)
MPKVISRSIIVTDQEDEVEAELARHHVYYCLCKQMVMIADVEINGLPGRKFDGARLLPPSTKYKLESREGDVVCLKRGEGKERQYRQTCKYCPLPIAYTAEKGGNKLYILDGALVKQDEPIKLRNPDGKQKELVVAPLAASSKDDAGQEETSVTMRRHTKSAGKFSSVSVATTSEAEEKALESRELESNYDANAKVIEMLLGRSKAGKKRDAMEGDKAKADAKRRKGTLLL